MCPDLSIFQTIIRALSCINQAAEAGFRDDKLKPVLGMIREKKPIEETGKLELTDMEESSTDGFSPQILNPSAVGELAPLLKNAQNDPRKFYGMSRRRQNAIRAFP